MNKKLISGILVVLVILGAGYYYYSDKKPSEMPATTGKKVNQDTAQISWKTTPAPEKDGIPQTKVEVVINGTSKTIGTYNGSCAQVGANGGIDGKGLVVGELSAVQCWYAGTGDEIGVFAVEDGSVEVMIGSLGEQGEGQGLFRGDFQIQTDI
jgi:hypothetical protein